MLSNRITRAFHTGKKLTSEIIVKNLAKAVSNNKPGFKFIIILFVFSLFEVFIQKCQNNLNVVCNEGR